MMLNLDRLQFHYNGKEILKEVSFCLKKGEIGTLIGASGSGKTTLFKILTGLISSQKGHLTIDQELAPAGHEKIACMMQQDLLLPWRTVIKNLTLLKELGQETYCKKTLSEEANQLLIEMGLSHVKNQLPSELSVGMRQRVSLARALLQKRPILLLDEPFASLDVALREHMYLLLRTIQKKEQTTMLMVTHDFRDALSLSDHIFFLSEGVIKNKWQVSDSIRNDPQASGLLLHELRHSIVH